MSRFVRDHLVRRTRSDGRVIETMTDRDTAAYTVEWFAEHHPEIKVEVIGPEEDD